MFIDIICIKDCDSGQKDFTLYSKIGSTYKYKKGIVYSYNLTKVDHQFNSVYNIGIYCGSINNSFVIENFIKKTEYDTELKFVDDLFEYFLFQSNSKILIPEI